jgi:hypothetical protein
MFRKWHLEPRRTLANQNFVRFPISPKSRLVRVHPAIRRSPAATRELGVESCGIEPTDTRKAPKTSTSLSASTVPEPFQAQSNAVKGGRDVWEGPSNRALERLFWGYFQCVRLFFKTSSPSPNTYSTLNTLRRAFRRGTRRIVLRSNTSNSAPGLAERPFTYPPRLHYNTGFL